MSAAATLAAAMNTKPWQIRHFAVFSPADTLATESFETEIAARTRFDAAVKHARENGGGVELLNEYVRVERVCCAAPND
jgi:hypothetical protein